MTKSSKASRDTSSNSPDSQPIKDIVRRSIAFQKQAKIILSSHEASPARSITIEETYKTLRKLSTKQDDLFRQALRCVEYRLYRAAHVLSWAAFMDFFEEKIASNLGKLNETKPNWKVKSVDDIRDIGSDFQIIEALREMQLCGKTDEKALKGLLNRRNECAHPTDYYPKLNETLGYVSEIIGRLESFQKRGRR